MLMIVFNQKYSENDQSTNMLSLLPHAKISKVPSLFGSSVLFGEHCDFYSFRRFPRQTLWVYFTCNLYSSTPLCFL